MILSVNGEQREVPDGTTVRGLIEQLGLASGPVAEPCEIALGRGREVRLAPGRSGVLRVMPM